MITFDFISMKRSEREKFKIIKTIITHFKRKRSNILYLKYDFSYLLFYFDGCDDMLHVLVLVNRSLLHSICTSHTANNSPPPQ